MTKTQPKKCSRCSGVGTMIVNRSHEGRPNTHELCDQCGGTGKQPKKCPNCTKEERDLGLYCPTCNGTGEQPCEFCNGRALPTCPNCHGKQADSKSPTLQDVLESHNGKHDGVQRSIEPNQAETPAQATNILSAPLEVTVGRLSKRVNELERDIQLSVLNEVAQAGDYSDIGLDVLNTIKELKALPNQADIPTSDLVSKSEKKDTNQVEAERQARIGLLEYMLTCERDNREAGHKWSSGDWRKFVEAELQEFTEALPNSAAPAPVEPPTANDYLGEPLKNVSPSDNQRELRQELMECLTTDESFVDWFHAESRLDALIKQEVDKAVVAELEKLMDRTKVAYGDRASYFPPEYNEGHGIYKNWPIIDEPTFLITKSYLNDRISQIKGGQVE